MTPPAPGPPEASPSTRGVFSSRINETKPIVNLATKRHFRHRVRHRVRPPASGCPTHRARVLPCLVWSTSRKKRNQWQHA
eukprot:6618692-Prorocentrum_lima.AAC.1